MGLATIAILAGGGMQAYGQYQQGKAAEAQGKAEQQIAEYNAKLKERQGAAELERARAQATQFEKEGEVLKGEQIVGFAKGGVLTTEGTPALLLEETAAELEADRMAILREGFLGRSFREGEAEGLRFEGRAAKARGQNLAAASKYQAVGTLLTTFGSAYASYSAGGGGAGGGGGGGAGGGGGGGGSVGYGDYTPAGYTPAQWATIRKNAYSGSKTSLQSYSQSALRYGKTTTPKGMPAGKFGMGW